MYGSLSEGKNKIRYGRLTEERCILFTQEKHKPHQKSMLGQVLFLNFPIKEKLEKKKRAVT